MKKILLSIFVFSFSWCLQGAGIQGYSLNQFASMTLSANATGSFAVTGNAERFWLIGDGAPFEFTLNYATSTVYIASQPEQWEGYPATWTHDFPHQVRPGRFIWIKNGAVTQKIRFKGLGY